MTLEGRNLRFRTAKAELFNADISDVEAKLSIYATLTIHIRSTGQKYRFLTGAYVPGNAGKFTQLQRAELAGKTGEREHDQALGGLNVYIGSNVIATASSMGGSSSGDILGAIGEISGAYSMTKAQRISFYAAYRWAAYLQSRGVAIRIRTDKYMTSQIVVVSIVISILLIMIATILATVTPA